MSSRDFEGLNQCSRDLLGILSTEFCVQILKEIAVVLKNIVKCSILKKDLQTKSIIVILIIIA